MHRCRKGLRDCNMKKVTFCRVKGNMEAQYISTTLTKLLALPEICNLAQFEVNNYNYQCRKLCNGVKRICAAAL